MFLSLPWRRESSWKVSCLTPGGNCDRAGLKREKSGSGPSRGAWARDESERAMTAAQPDRSLRRLARLWEPKARVLRPKRKSGRRTCLSLGLGLCLWLSVSTSTGLLKARSGAVLEEDCAITLPRNSGTCSEEVAPTTKATAKRTVTCRSM